MNHTPTIASPLPCAFCRGQALFVTQSLFVIHPLPLDYGGGKGLNWVLPGLVAGRWKGRIRDHAKTAAGQPAAVLAWSLLCSRLTTRKENILPSSSASVASLLVSCQRVTMLLRSLLSLLLEFAGTPFCELALGTSGFFLFSVVGEVVYRILEARVSCPLH